MASDNQNLPMGPHGGSYSGELSLPPRSLFAARACLLHQRLLRQPFATALCTNPWSTWRRWRSTHAQSPERWARPPPIPITRRKGRVFRSSSSTEAIRVPARPRAALERNPGVSTEVQAVSTIVFSRPKRSVPTSQKA